MTKKKNTSETKPNDILKIPSPLEQFRARLQKELDATGYAGKIIVDIVPEGKDSAGITFTVKGLTLEEAEAAARTFTTPKLFEDDPKKRGLMDKATLSIENMDPVSWLDKQREKRERESTDTTKSR